jgi:hypothetical protein
MNVIGRLRTPTEAVVSRASAPRRKDRHGARRACIASQAGASCISGFWKRSSLASFLLYAILRAGLIRARPLTLYLAHRRLADYAERQGRYFALNHFRYRRVLNLCLMRFLNFFTLYSCAVLRMPVPALALRTLRRRNNVSRQPSMSTCYNFTPPCPNLDSHVFQCNRTALRCHRTATASGNSAKNSSTLSLGI